jgi:hypothetical protein
MDTTRKLGRRGLLAGGVGALVAALFGRVGSASADNGSPLVLGEQNAADQPTQLAFGGTGGALEIDWGDPARGNASRAVLGDGTHNGTPVYGELVPAVQKAWTTASAGWFNGGQSPGAVGVSDAHIGVIGLSGPVPAISPQELDPAGGHFVGAGGAGLCARSDTRPGALGMSDGNVGLVGATGVKIEHEDELYDLGAAGVVGVSGGGAVAGSTGGVGVWGIAGEVELNPQPFPPAPAGLWGQGGDGGIGTLAQGHIGMWGATPEADVSLNPQPLPPTGVWGQGVPGEVGVLGQGGVGVWGASPGVQVSLNPQPLPPTGIWGQGAGTDAFGVVALNGDGRALSVRGRAAFSGVAKGSIPPKSNSAFVAAPTIDDRSLVSLTLTGDPGGAIPWVEVQPGRGFVVHLTANVKGPAPLSFTYLLIEHEG